MSGKYSPETVQEMRSWMDANKASLKEGGKKYGIATSSLGYALTESPGARILGKWSYPNRNRSKSSSISKDPIKNFIDIVTTPEPKKEQMVTIVILPTSQAKTFLESLNK